LTLKGGCLFTDVTLPSLYNRNTGNNVYNPRVFQYFHPTGTTGLRLTQPPSMMSLPPLKHVSSLCSFTSSLCSLLSSLCSLLSSLCPFTSSPCSFTSSLCSLLSSLCSLLSSLCPFTSSQCSFRSSLCSFDNLSFALKHLFNLIESLWNLYYTHYVHQVLSEKVYSLTHPYDIFSAY